MDSKNDKQVELITDVASIKASHNHMVEDIKDIKQSVKDGFKEIKEALKEIKEESKKEKEQNMQALNKLNDRVIPLETEHTKKKENRILIYTALFTSVAAILGSAAMVLFEVMKGK